MSMRTADDICGIIVQKQKVSLVSSIGQFLVLPSLALQHLLWSALLHELSYSDLYSCCKDYRQRLSRDNNSFSLPGSKQHQFRSSGTAPAEHYTRLRVVPQSPDIIKSNMRHADGSSLAWKRGTC